MEERRGPHSKGVNELGGGDHHSHYNATNPQEGEGTELASVDRLTGYQYRRNMAADPAAL